MLGEIIKFINNNMDYKILGIIPVGYAIYLIIRIFQKNDVDKIVGKIIGKERLNKLLTRADLIFGFKKRNSDGSMIDKTPIWVKILVIIMYVALLIFAVGSIIGILYFLFFEK